MNKVWFITGATRGIGAEIAKAALAVGERVVATGRKPEAVTRAVGASENLFVTALDVTHEDQIQVSVQAAAERFGHIDVLVNNAGYGHLGVFEETTPEEIRAQYDTNVFGLMAVTRAIIPGMRQRRSGRIFNISSVSGLRGIFGGSIYNSSKVAVEGFSLALAEELASFGVYVTCVLPGSFRTDFLDPTSVRYSDVDIDDYARAWAELRAFHDKHNHAQTGDPARLAAALLHLATIDKPPVWFVAGSDAVEWATNAIMERQTELNEWRDLSISTDGNW